VQGFFPTTPLLLTDGRVLTQDANSANWWLLTPDANGSYVNGTWSQAATPPQCLNTNSGLMETWRPVYMATAVVPDGRVVAIGGEYNFAIDPNNAVDTPIGEIYDPKANTWTCLSNPSRSSSNFGPWTNVGDAMSAVLPNGTGGIGPGQFLLGDAFGSAVATLDLTKNPPTWNVVNPTLTGKSTDNTGYNNEEGWTLLPSDGTHANGRVLTLEVWSASNNSTTTLADQYNPSTRTWESLPAAPKALVLVTKGSTTYREIGPAVLRPDGTVFATGATGHTAIYNSTGGTVNSIPSLSWAAGPDFPASSVSGNCGVKGSYVPGTQILAPVDGPAALLPNGNVLVETSPIDDNCSWINGTRFFEFNGSTLTEVQTTANGSITPSFVGRLLVLPTGQVLFVDGTGDAEVYIPTNQTPFAGSAPAITNSPATLSAGATNMLIKGTQFNGLSQAVAYGDDYQAATNYPLVRITSGTSVFYARTHGHSTMGVATGATIVSTYFDVPVGVPAGAATLAVIANGIPSSSVPITILPATTTTLGSSSNPSTKGTQITLTATVTGLGASPGTVTFYDGIDSTAPQLGSPVTPTAGVAQIQNSSLAVGTHTITATYSGDASAGASTSSAVLQVVNGTATTTAVTSNTNPSNLNVSTQFNSSVTPGGTLTGTVTYMEANPSGDGNTILSTVNVPASGLAPAISVPLQYTGTHTITAVYSGDANFSGSTATLAGGQQVNNPVPSVNGLGTQSATLGTPPFNLVVFGSNFVGNSVVQFNGSARATTYQSSNQIFALLQQSDLNTAGTFTITVFNPTPGGGTSSPGVNFTVNNPSPTLTSISPNSGALNTQITNFVLTGTGFIQGTSVVNFGSNQISSGVVTNGGTTLTVTVPAGDVNPAGAIPVTVTNGGPGGGTSGYQPFTTTGAVQGTLSLSNLSGTGSQIDAGHYTDNFGNVQAQTIPEWALLTTPPTHHYQMQNTGPDSIIITNFTVSGNGNQTNEYNGGAGTTCPLNENHFVPFEIVAGGSCDLFLTFEPETLGVRTVVPVFTAFNSTVPTVTVTISGTGTTGSASVLNVTQGATQSTLINTAFPTPVLASLQDANGFPIVGAPVQFTITGSAGGASGTFPGGLTQVTVNADAGGIAVAPAITANGTAGFYSLAVSASAGALNIGPFTLRNYGFIPNIQTIVGGGLGTTPSGAPAGSGGICPQSQVGGIFSGNIYFRSCAQVFRMPVGGGTWTLVAGNGIQGFSGDGGDPKQAEIAPNGGIYVDTNGNVILAEGGLNRVREIFASGPNAGTIQTIAGMGTAPGYNVYDSSNPTNLTVFGTMPANAAQLSNPQGVFEDANGNIFIADSGNNLLREVIGGIIQQIGGTGCGTTWNPVPSANCPISGFNGDNNAFGTNLSNPQGIFVDGSSNVWFADSGLNRIRELVGADITDTNGIGGGGTITTIIGLINGAASVSEGVSPTSTGMGGPQKVWVDGPGNVFYTDSNNNLVRKWTKSSNLVNTIAGSFTAAVNSGSGYMGYSGDTGPATSARTFGPNSVYVDPATNNVYFSSLNGIRKVDTTGTINAVIGNSAFGLPGNAAATSSPAFYAQGVARDQFGNIYYADAGNYVIREVNGLTGVASTIVGSGTPGFSGDNAGSNTALTANIQPRGGLAVDSAGNVFWTDGEISNPALSNCRVREYLAATKSVTTVAGGSCAGNSENVAAIGASLPSPVGLALDSSGNIFIAQGSRIRAVNRQATTQTINGVSIGAGNIATVAGTGVGGFNNDNSNPNTGTTVQINGAQGVAVDSSGNVLIADTSNNRVRKLSTTGALTTIAGTAINVFNGDFITATNANLNQPLAVALDSASPQNVFIAENTFRVREIFESGGQAGQIATIAFDGNRGFSGDGGPAISATANQPAFIAIDSAGNALVGDRLNARVRFVGSNNPAPTITSLSPNNAVFNSGAFALAVTGSNFVPNTFVTFGGTAYPTTFTDANHVTAAIPGSAISSTGTPAVNVNNPIPGGGTSTNLTFTVTGGATITFTNNNGTGDGKWTTATNWDLGRVPNSTDTVVINGAVVTGSGSSNVTLDSTSPAIAVLSMSGSTTLTITGTGALTTTAGSTATSITISGGTLTANAALTLSGTLTFSSGTLNGTGNVTLGGSSLFNFSGGTMSGTGLTKSSGTVTVSGTPPVLSGRTLEIASGGTATMSAASAISFSGAAILTIDSGATFNASTTNGGGGGIFGSGTINNAGTFNRATAGSAFFARIAFNNNATGTVNVTAGGLNLQGGGTDDGAFVVNGAGTSLEFGTTGTPTSLTPTSSITGGTGNAFIDFDIFGTTNIAGTYSFTGTTLISNASAIVNFNAPTGSTATLTLSAGTLNTASTSAFTVTGTMTFSGGTLNNIGTTTVANTGTLNWSGGTYTGTGTLASAGTATISGSTATLNGGTFNNTGTLSFPASLTFTIENGAHFNNQSTGTINVNGSGSLSDPGSPASINNAGTFNATTGTLTTAGVGLTYTNSGTTTLTGGSLSLATNYAQTTGTTALTGAGTLTAPATNISGGTIKGISQINGTSSNPALSLAPGGTVKPGLSPGILTVNGNGSSSFNSGTGTVRIEIAGNHTPGGNATPGTDNDELNLAGGPANLGGTLQPVLTNGYTPVLGDSFRIITSAGLISGTLANVDSSSAPLSAGLAWAVNYNPSGTNTVVLTVINATVTFTPASHDFGSVTAGQQSAVSNITLNNNGASPLILNSITFVGANSGDFLTATPTTGIDCTQLAPVPVGSSCNIGVKFAPQAAGAKSAQIKVVDGAPDSPHFASVTGTGTVAGTLTLTGGTGGTATAPTYDYGNQVVGTQTAVHTFVLSNTGPGDITVSNFTLTGNTNDFQTMQPPVGTDCPLNPQNFVPFVLTANGGSCNIRLYFAPTALGTRSAAPTFFATNSTVASIAAAVSGTGIGGNDVYTNANNTGVWQDDLNWSLGHQPNVQDTAIINGVAPNSSAVTLSGGSSPTIAALTMSNTTTLTITLSMQLTVSSALTASNSTAIVVINGANLTLNGASTAGNLSLGPTSGSGFLAANGTLSVGGTLALANGTITGTGNITSSGVFNWSGFGSTVSGTGSFTNAGTGTANITAGTLSGKTFNNSGTATVSNLSFSNNAQFNNSGTFNATTNGSGISASTATPGAFANLVGGTITAAPGISNTWIDSGIPFTNAGTINISSGNFTLVNSSVPASTATFTQSGGLTQIASGASLSSQATMTLSGGALGGFGSVLGTVNNTGGTLSPGASPGLLTIGSGYTQGAGGSLLTELAGTTAGTQYDQLNVSSGSVTLGGTLNVSLLGGFVPAVGNSFTLITSAGNISGTFATKNLPALPGLESWQLAYSPNGTNTVTLTVVAPSVSFDQNPLAFGNQLVGTTSPQRVLAVTNPGGSGVTLNASPISIVGTNGTGNGEFTIATTTCTSGFVLTANSANSCTININFTPAATGARSATLTITSNATNSPTSTSLTGTGVVPGALITPPSPFGFGNQTTGTTSSPAQIFSVSNIGGAPLHITSVALGGNDPTQFVFANSGPGSCAPPVTLPATFGLCTFTVAFSPTTSGAKSATVTVTDDAGNVAGTTQVETVTGTGVAPSVIFSVTPVTFGNQRINTTSVSMKVTLTNNGGLDTTLAASTPVTIIGSNFSEFAVQSTTCTASFVLKANGASSCDVNITFTPSATGARTATLNIFDNAPGSPQTDTLNGTGVQPIVTLAPSPLNFSSQRENVTSAAFTVTVKNSGNQDTTLASSNAVSISGTNQADFAIAAGTTCSVNFVLTANGGQCLVKITFTPSILGGETATLNVADDAPNTPQQDTLNGTGVIASVALAPSPLDFGNQQQSTTSGALTITITNSGTDISTLAPSNPVTLSTGNTTDFTILPAAGGTTCIASFVLTANGGKCVVMVTFTPGAVGLRQTTINVADDAPGTPQQATVKGTGVPGPPAAIQATGGTPQSVLKGTAFGAALQATVSDRSGNPISGVTVTFQAPASRASGSFAGGVNTALTNGSGVATSTVFTANSVVGSYNVTASTGGVPTVASFSLTNLPGAAASVIAIGGTPQNAVKSTAFGVLLQAMVLDGSGSPVTGVTVTFQAPGSGVSGMFANGTATTTAITNASGVAAASAFTANSTLGSYTVTASVAGVAAPANYLLANTPTAPATILATAGAPQSAQVNTAFGSLLQATVQDVSGNPVSGVTVTFHALGTRASGSFAGGVNTAVTNGSGVATSAVFTANNTVGSYTVTASVSGVATPANYSLTNIAGVPTLVIATGGTPQYALSSHAFGSALQATVRDGSGNLVSGVTVTFQAPVSGPSGTFANGTTTTTAITNSAGLATASMFTANSTVGGPYVVTATVSGVAAPANFSLTNGTTLITTVVATGGTPQNAVVNTAFGSLLQVTVKDGSGSPVPNATVTFQAPGSRASGSFAGGVNTAATNGNGVATSAVFTANSKVGSYTVTASVAGVSASASYVLTNSPGAAAVVAPTGGTPQDAVKSTAFGTPLQAMVQDGNGNPVPGVAVTFQAPVSGASGTFANGTTTTTATTNIAGLATASTFTANSTVGGPYVVTATVSGVAAPANYSLTNVPLALAMITATGGTPQSASVNMAFAAPLKATVKDGNGNPLQGVTVTFQIPAGRIGGSFAGGVNTAVTDINGVATSTVFTASGSTGTYIVTAIVSGVAAAAGFTLTNTP
jgi:hypothetical protein